MLAPPQIPSRRYGDADKGVVVAQNDGSGVAYVIDQSRCINCAWCRRECPTDTIHYFDQANRKHNIDPQFCIDCDICARVCPMDCISYDPELVPDPDSLAHAKQRARAWARDRRQLKLGIRAYAESQVLKIVGNGS